MKNDNQDDVCEFVREIVSVRTREPITLTERPDRERRDIKAVEELWESSSQVPEARDVGARRAHVHAEVLKGL